MLRSVIVVIPLFCAVFVFYSDPAYAVEPFVVDDFENGLGLWSTGQGGGAAGGSIEETKDAHNDKTAGRVIMPEGSGWMMIRTQPHDFAALGEGYEAFNFWAKGIEGSDKFWIRLMFVGFGNITGVNRWIYDFKVPLNQWTLISMPFEDIQPWRKEERDFELGFLSYISFTQEGSPPLGGEQTSWGDIEFIVDQIEFGLAADMPVQPLSKLTTTWAGIKVRD